MSALLTVRAQNFRSLKDVSVDLGQLNVLVGPNQAGKSNFLDLIEFVGDSARSDLAAALDDRGGIDRVRYRGASDSGKVVVDVKANVTQYSSRSAPDEYRLSFWTQRLRNRRTDAIRRVLHRQEQFKFKRTKGQGRRITVKGDQVDFISVESSGHERSARKLPLDSKSLALSTLRRLPKSEGGAEIDRVANLFSSFRVFNVDVAAARLPQRRSRFPIQSDASNLASVLMNLAQADDDAFGDYVDDAKAMIPGLEAIEFEAFGGASPAYAVTLIERGLLTPTYLEDASFGAIRVLALLALLYDPDPPQITCIEEVDHGLHPYVFDRLVTRLREASKRTQILVATHSPALVNRLAAKELIVCERAADGSTRLPAVDSEEIAEKERVANGRLRLGELWFSGSLGGVPE